MVIRTKLARCVLAHLLNFINGDVVKWAWVGGFPNTPDRYGMRQTLVAASALVGVMTSPLTVELMYMVYSVRCLRIILSQALYALYRLFSQTCVGLEKSLDSQVIIKG